MAFDLDDEKFSEYAEKFDEWMVTHDKKYFDKNEYNMRLQIFIDNLLYIEEKNMKGLSYELGLNAFSDLTFEEFKSTYLITTPQNCSATNKKRRPLEGVDLPVSIDWRTKGVITPVKNQGSCGSCWTFSTTGCLEAHHAIRTGKLISLSEQQLVDCAQAFKNHGCKGGLPSQAFEYIRYNKGLESEEDYPYRAHDETCHFEISKVAATVRDVFNITMDDEEGIVEAVGTVGPVSIAYQVVKDFMHYKSGIYSSTECHNSPDDVNHAVLAVGYNVAHTGEKYWIVKNSWGTKFGMNGYFWIERGKNMCGLATCASYPIV